MSHKLVFSESNCAADRTRRFSIDLVPLDPGGERYHIGIIPPGYLASVPLEDYTDGVWAVFHALEDVLLEVTPRNPR